MASNLRSVHNKYPVWVHFQDEKNGINYSSNTKSIDILLDKKSKESYKIISWGDNNLLCDDRDTLIEENNIIPKLLETKRNITIGGGIMTYENQLDENGKRKIVEIDDDIVSEALDDLDEDDFWEQVATDFVKNSLAYAYYNKDDAGVWKMKVVRARYVRPQEQNEVGIIEHFFLCGDWTKRENINKVLSYEAFKILKEHDKTTPNEFIKRISDDFMGNEYFPTPVWFTGSKWIESANKIPRYFNEFMKNANFSAVLISMPKDYFFDTSAYQKGDEAIKKARDIETTKRTNFLKQIDEVLAGADNAGKTVWVEYFISQMEKEYGGIKFEELKGGKPDEGILKLYDKTIEALISGTGVHPSLAAIITSGGLSSGSEIRNALDMFIITQIVLLRKQLVKFAKTLKKLNEWDKKIKFNFRDVQITTTDKNPTGSQNVTAN